LKTKKSNNNIFSAIFDRKNDLIYLAIAFGVLIPCLAYFADNFN